MSVTSTRAPPSRRGARRLLGCLGLITCAALGSVALADSRAGDDGKIARALIEDVAREAHHGTLAGEPLSQARRALERAAEARAAGDHEHGALLDALGREWAETARDLVRAAETEREADKLEREAHELESKLLRARSLLEETVARRGRAQETLEQLEGADGGARAAPSGGKP